MTIAQQITRVLVFIISTSSGQKKACTSQSRVLHIRETLLGLAAFPGQKGGEGGAENVRS